MRISKIYQKYQIMPNLQMHQLRAAAVGAVIADSWKGSMQINRDMVIATLLLHDMGNIIKFELGRFPHLLGEEQKRLKYWENVQKFYLEKYGQDEHEATFAIAKEIGIPREIQRVLENMGSTNLKKVADMNEFNPKITIYSDMRIAPHGVVGVNARFDDLIMRYQGRDHPIADIERTERNRQYSLEVERQLQTHVSIDLNEITDKTIERNIEDFKNFEI